MLSLLMIVAVYLCSVDLSEAQSCGCTPRFRRDADIALLKNITNKGEALVEGDMIFSKNDAMIYAGFRAAEHSSKRWSRGEVFYEMSKMNGQEQQKIRQSLAALSQATQNCVRFTEVRGQANGAYVSIFNAGAGLCYSSIGRERPGQQLSLGQGCMDEHTIQHEFMHALGFYHEQSRPDRDQFVQVNWGNIDSNMCHNFQRCAGCTLTTPYDILSIMQYVGVAFGCKQGMTTMAAKSGQVIGWNTRLTANDVKKIKDYYQCTNGPSPVA
jgi:hypothetical protein